MVYLKLFNCISYWDAKLKDGTYKLLFIWLYKFVSSFFCWPWKVSRFLGGSQKLKIFFFTRSWFKMGYEPVLERLPCEKEHLLCNFPLLAWIKVHQILILQAKSTELFVVNKVLCNFLLYIMQPLWYPQRYTPTHTHSHKQGFFRGCYWSAGWCLSSTSLSLTIQTW